VMRRWRWMGCATHSSQPKRVPLLLLSAALATLMALPSAPNSCSALQASPAQASAAPICRRGHALRWLGAAATGLLLEGSAATPVIAEDDKKADYLGIEKMPGLAGKQYGKQRKRMPNFTVLPSGLQVKDVDLGRADTPEPREGDAVVITGKATQSTTLGAHMKHAPCKRLNEFRWSRFVSRLAMAL